MSTKDLERELITLRVAFTRRRRRWWRRWFQVALALAVVALVMYMTQV